MHENVRTTRPRSESDAVENGELEVRSEETCLERCNSSAGPMGVSATNKVVAPRQAVSCRTNIREPVRPSAETAERDRNNVIHSYEQSCRGTAAHIQAVGGASVNLGCRPWLPNVTLGNPTAVTKQASTPESVATERVLASPTGRNNVGG